MSLRSERFHQFKDIDTMVGIGGSHKFTEGWLGDAFVALTPSADFKPSWRFEAGSSARLFTLSDRRLWGHYQISHDRYHHLSSTKHALGVDLPLPASLLLSPKALYIHQSSRKTNLGASVQVDGEARDVFTYRLGYAVTADVDQSGVDPVRTVFSSLTTPVTDAVTLRFDIAHENHTYATNRINIDVGLAYKF